MSKLFLFILVITGSRLHAQQNDLIAAYRQTRVTVSEDFQRCSGDRNLGNCAAIALIKCAQAQFGSLQNIFKNIAQQPDNSYHITFNDDVMVQITPGEINIVKQLSGILPNAPNQFYEDAMVIYAAICKSIQNNNTNSCINNFTHAVEHLNSGFSTPGAHRLLGFKRKDVAPTAQNAILWCNAHAAYSSNGMQDLLGQPTPLKRKKMRNLARYSKIKGAYILEK